MSTEENKAVVRRWNSEDELWSLELLGEAYVNRSGTEAPWAPIMQGLEEARARFAEMRQASPTFRVTIEDIVAEGDKVAVRLTWYREGKPTANAMAFYRLSGGKIVDDWFCETDLKKG